MENEAHDEEWCRLFRRRLLRWYSNNKRALPWRETRDPYSIWISEIMLQQTQVATVIEYFNRFLTRFPNIQALAAADEETVLKYWSGLGYYRRARSLHAAAKKIVERHAGEFPRRFQDVLGMPGVGRYTAGAITSLAFDARQPILEANTVRLFARLLGLREDPGASRSQAVLWEFAEAILPHTRGSGKTNQAVMELGSLVCTPQAPRCTECPAQELCRTYRDGLQAEIPAPKAKPRITEEIHALAVVRQRNRLLLRRNQTGEWWTGLWDFPRQRIAPLTHARQRVLHNLKPGQPLVLDSELRQLIESSFLAGLGLPCSLASMPCKLTHGVTRFRIRLLCFEARVPETFKLGKLAGDWKWMSSACEPELPLTSPANKVFQNLTGISPRASAASSATP